MRSEPRLRWLLTAAAGLLAVWSTPVSAAETDRAPDAEAERIAGDVAGAEPTAAGLARIHWLNGFSSLLPRGRYQKLLGSTIDAVDAPLLEFPLRRELNRVRRERGKVDGGALAGSGCLRSWSLVGPFDNNTMRAFDKRLAPERGEAGPYDGKTAQVDWRELPDFDRGCVFRLGRTLQPSTAAVAYLGGTVRVDTAREARLMIGARGAYKVWVDGELVGRQQTNLGLHVDNRAWAVELDEGSHRILVKLATRSNGSMGFVARLVEADLEPIDGVEMTAEWGGEAVEEAADGDASPPEPTGQGVLARAKKCAKEADAPAASWCVRLWRRAGYAKAANPWRDVADGLAEPVLGESKSTSLELDARGLARIAGVFDDHADELRLLRRAGEMAPDDPWVAMRLVSAYRSSPGALNRRRARALLEKLVRNRPDFWPATLKLADWYDSNGFGAKALKLVRDIEVDRRLQRPAVVQRLASLESSSGSRERARKLRERLSQISAVSGAWAWEHLQDLASTGETRRALKFVRRQLELRPLSRQWGLEEVDLLRSLGEADEALVKLDEMIEGMPGDVGLRRRKAELLVSSERTRDAVAVLETALEIDPQNEGLDEYLSELKADRESFHEPWMIDEVRRYADKYPAGSFAHDRIIDQTVVRVSPNGLSKRVVQRVDRAITSEGVEAVSNHSVSYTRGDERVEVIDVKVYKSDGRVLEDYDKWRSGRSKKSGPYYNDQRYLNIRANNVEKGDLVEFRYRVRQVANENFRGDYFGDISYVQGSRPVGLWRYAVEAPENWELYFRKPDLTYASLGPERPGDEQAPPDYRVHGFELEEVPPVKTDPRQPGYADVYDYVLVSNKKTWDEVGEWWWNLVEEQLIVDDAIARAAEEATEGLEKDRAIVEALHSYVVENTRYLHVGLGIHGWKPYRTTQCFQNKYGDCKDKASLLKVMLEHAGVEANLVLVRTRDLGAVADDLGSMHVFNHAITYVPSLDLFVDPTAEFTGTGHLPAMDQGAQALIVKDGGATEFTRLPVDEARDNLLVRNLEVDLSKDPTVTTGRMVARGQNAVFYRRKLENPERRDEIFEKELTDLYPGADLVSASYENLDDIQEPVKIEFEFEGGRLERTSNGRSFLFPYGTPKNLRSRYAGQAERNQDLKIRIPFANETTMTYRLSPERSFEGVPESQTFESEFGAVEVAYEKREETLVVKVHYRIDVQRVPVEKYSEFRSFLSRATSALNETIGLTEETTE